ncbi:MAG: alpha/beta fold hydrolase [SAR324 cluster bacterium]|nr:alpha/beta fold hydrolase [SAR324 cluster bacterium]
MNRTPLVLLPGLLLDERMWQPQIESLQEIAECWVPDLSRADTMAEMARQVLAQAPERFALAGLSMGGLLSFELWRQAPERITRLALLDTNPRTDTPERQEDRRRQLRMAASGKFPEITTDVLLPRLVHPNRLHDQALGQVILDMALSVGPTGFCNQINAVLSRSNSVPTLPTITVPTLVLCGREDILTPLELHEEMAASIPDATLTVLEHCGHLSTLEQPGAVNRALRDWLTR